MIKKPDWIGSRQYIDKTYWVLFSILIVVAIIALFSASSTLAYDSAGSALGPIFHQMMFIALGVILAYGVQFLPTYMIEFGGYVLWAVAILCLIVMLVPGNPFVVNLNGAGRWFKLFGIQFQPSELAKLSLIIVVAHQLSMIHGPEDIKKRFLWTLGFTVATCFPIMTGNMSTAVLLAGVVFLMWFLARIPWQYMTITAGAAIVAALLFYFVIKFAYIEPGRELPKLFKRADTQIGRIDDLIAEHKQPTAEFELNDDNRQRSIAKVAIWRGGASPVGVLPGNSKERDFLPLAYADYIFAIIVEETGVMGAIGLIVLYLAILFRACYASSKYEDYVAMLMTMGLALMIVCQAFISMAVAVGIGPVTGQPLPMISKGGTSAVITSLYFGIMMAVAREQNQNRDRVNTSIQQSQQEVPIINL